MSRVLVVGGGFGGVETAIFLRREGLDVTLVSSRPFAWIYPVSIWIPTGGTTPEKVSMPLEKLARKHGFEVVVDEIRSLDMEGRKAVGERGSYAWDYLVLAPGATKLRPPGVEHTLSICGSPQDAERIRDRLRQLVDSGGGRIAMGFAGNPKDPSAVRGGPVFELLFNVDHWLRKKRVRDRFTLTFFSPMPEPGKKMGSGAFGLMERFFQRNHIEYRVGVPIQRFSEQGVHFTDGSLLESDLTVFVPGGAGLPWLAESGLPVNDAGFLVVDEQCRVQGQDRIWAVGDSAAVEGPQWRAKQGHLAEAMGRIAAADIALAARSEASSGKRPRAAGSYKEHMEIVCLMDSGNGGVLVQRNERRSRLLLLPILGHWLKLAWALYWKLSKLRIIPRLPGM